MSWQQTLASTRLGEDPGYWSGLPATRDYMSPDILRQVHGAIARDCGADAANQFLEMIADCPTLTPSGVIQRVRRLASNNWRWERNLLPVEQFPAHTHAQVELLAARAAFGMLPGIGTDVAPAPSTATARILLRISNAWSWAMRRLSIEPRVPIAMAEDPAHVAWMRRDDTAEIATEFLAGFGMTWRGNT